MAKKDLCAVIMWRIENFTYCWHKKERLFSEKFIIDSLDKAAFYLMLIPRGGDSSEDLGIYLKRATNDEGGRSIEISYDLSVLDKNDASFRTRNAESSFECNSSWGYASMLNRADLNCFADNLVHPSNIFSVECKIWLMSERRCKPTKIYIRSLIPVTKCSFSWKIDTATVLTYDHNKTILFEKLFGSEKSVKVTLDFLNENVNEVFVKIAVSGDMQGKFSYKCDMQNEHSKDSFLLKKNTIRRLPYEEKCAPLISMHQINADSQKYLIGTALVLNCEFSLISHSVKNSENVCVCYSEPPSIWYRRFDGKYETAYLADERNFIEPVPCNCPLKQDIRKLYRNNLKSDFTMQVGCEVFDVHSSILSARSPVLCRMFENDMKEKQNKILKVEDLESNTVKKMLDYVYIDDPGELTVDAALKLYYAADKYDIVGLKKKSSNYLMQNITTVNVYEILILAHRHSDEFLKNSAISFIFQHEKDILPTDQYKTMCKNNFELGLEIIQELSKRRFKRFKPDITE